MPRRCLALALALSLVVPLLTRVGQPPTASAGDTFALPAFRAIWEQADQPVAARQVARPWLWGPGPVTGPVYETYQETPTGQRLVQYFDKARMEDNGWRSADPLWRVTNGLLVAELIAGRRQTGDARATTQPPAAISVAGDPGSGPTYANLAGLLAAPPLPVGALVTARLLPGGQVVADQPAPAEVRVGHLAPGPQHTIADPFWEFISGPGAVDGNPFFATGFPITEPYWTEARLDGQPRQVLLQAFERRVLTYTPGNPAGFVVEMGNVGRHYHEWRYGHPPTLPAEPVSDALQPTPLVIPEALRTAVAAETGGRLLNRTVALPPGFSISLYGLAGAARFMAFSPVGVLHVADRAGAIAALPDRDGDGVADERTIVASGLNTLHSLAFHAGGLYVAESHQIVRFDDDDGDSRPDRRIVIVPDLPNGGQHSSRTIAFGPDGKLYVAVGSSCNVCLESDWRRAAILQYNADGSGGRVFASGLRNAVGLAWQPGASRLFATENGRDHLGDDAPPEEVNEIREGASYGWPRCHGLDIRDPRFGQDAAACVGQTPPVVLMQAHSAPLGLAFVQSAMFPASYQGDLIVAFHGSWNRSVPTGYKLVRLPVRDGQPTGQVLDFLTGFWADDAWSRPVGVVFGPDQALYVSDDRAGAIFRITYGAAGP